MRITTNTQPFAVALRMLARVTPSKPAIPVLANVLFRATDVLTLQATDLEIAFSTPVAATIHAPGEVTLPAAKLLAIVEQLPAQDISIELDAKGHVNVASGAFKSRLQALAATEFPTLPEVAGDETTFSAESLRRLIKRAKYAINSEEKRYALNGALLELNGHMALVATDGKRLSSAKAEYTGVALRDTIIPAETLKRLLEIDYDGDVTFSKGERHLFFQMGERLLISRMLDGEFPNYHRIIPKDNDKRATINRAAFSAALRRVGLVSEQNQSTFLELAPSSLTLSASSAEIGSADEEISVEYDGSPLKLCCNWRFILDFLENATSSTILFEAKTPESPIQLTDGTFINIVMTMRA